MSNNENELKNQPTPTPTPTIKQEQVEAKQKSAAPVNTPLSFSVSPTLEYHYKDIANVHLGNSDLLVELGNVHRGMPGKATISNRVVLSFETAAALNKNLATALAEAKRRFSDSSK